MPTLVFTTKCPKGHNTHTHIYINVGMYMFIDSSKYCISQKLSFHTHTHTHSSMQLQVRACEFGTRFIASVISCLYLVIANANVSAIVIVISNTNYCRRGEFSFYSSNNVLCIRMCICICFCCCFVVLLFFTYYWHSARNCIHSKCNNFKFIFDK